MIKALRADQEDLDLLYREPSPLAHIRRPQAEEDAQHSAACAHQEKEDAALDPHAVQQLSVSVDALGRWK